MPNQTLKLKWAAILVSRGIKVLQAAPAGELHRSALQNVHKSNGEPMPDKIRLEMISPRERQPPERPDGDPKELNTCRLVMLQELTETSTPMSSLITLERSAQ